MATCSWFKIRHDPIRLLVEVGAPGQPWPPEEPVEKLIRHLEGLPSSARIDLCFLNCTSQDVVPTVALPIVEAFLRSEAEDLTVDLGGRGNADLQVEFLSQEAAKQAITKVSVSHQTSSSPIISALGELENLRLLVLSACGPVVVSQLSQVKLSDTCREFVICNHEFNGGGNDEATNLVKFLQKNRQVDCLRLDPINVSETKIIAAHLEEVTKLRHLTLSFAETEEAFDGPLRHHGVILQQVPQLFTALAGIEFTQGLKLKMTMDDSGVRIVQQLARNMKGDSRKLVINWDFQPAAGEPQASSETLSSCFRAAIGPDSNLLEFEQKVIVLRLDPAAAALEEVLPNLSPRLRKLKLRVDIARAPAANTVAECQDRILAALHRNTNVLRLHSLELEVNGVVLDQDFGATKSHHWFKSMTDNRGFPLEDLPEALELIEGNPHLDTDRYNLTMNFHCLRIGHPLTKLIELFRSLGHDDATVKIVETYLEQFDKGEQQAEAPASQETIVEEILPAAAVVDTEDAALETGECSESTTTKRKREDDSNAAEETQE